MDSQVKRMVDAPASNIVTEFLWVLNARLLMLYVGKEL